KHNNADVLSRLHDLKNEVEVKTLDTKEAKNKMSKREKLIQKLASKNKGKMELSRISALHVKKLKYVGSMLPITEVATPQNSINEEESSSISDEDPPSNDGSDFVPGARESKLDVNEIQYSGLNAEIIENLIASTID
ncbi:6051_t:CDS:2, partial [Dentiscutata erythropus]